MPSRSPWTGGRGSGDSLRTLEQPATPLAQNDGDGLGIQNVRRMVGRAALEGLGSDVTVSSDDVFAPLSTPLTMEVVLSGRPLRVDVSATLAAGASGNLAIDVQLRGVSVTGQANGLIYMGTTSILTLTGFELAQGFQPGPAKLEVVALRRVANGTIYATSSNRLVLLASEE